MTNYDSNYAIAQEISARIGNSPIPFDSVYSICLEIYNELGGEPAQFDSVYEILLGILPLVEGGIATKVIDDTSIRLDKTWSSSKLNSMFNNIPQLEAGENIEIIDNKINAKGYKFIDDNNGFAEHYERTVTPLEQELSLEQIGMTDLKFSGAAGVTTYILSGENAADFLGLPSAYFSMFGIKLTNGDRGYIDSVDATNSTVTFKETLDANNALSEVPATNLLMKFDIFLSGSANTTTYSIQIGSPETPSLNEGDIIYISSYGERTITEIDSENMTITLNSTLDKENAVSNVRIEATVQYNTLASGNYSHAEGANTIASGSYSHSEGFRTQASGDWGSHTEGQRTTASGESSHAEGYQTQASGDYSHAEGESTIASGYYSHSEGSITKATGDFGTHAEGYQTEARGICSHAEGYGGKNKNNVAIGPGSHVEGCMTITNNKAEHAEGNVNVSHKNSDNDGDAGNTLSSIGCGIYANVPKNAREIMQNGDCYILGIGGYQGTDTKVQNASIRTLQDVVNGKADAYETATTADIEALFSNQ